jgi:hypothetical protein
MSDHLEFKACYPGPIDPRGFNSGTMLPYDGTARHLQSAMEEFRDFLGFVNQQLYPKQIPTATSRRTITASVTQLGYQKMMSNWIYKAPELL